MNVWYRPLEHHKVANNENNKYFDKTWFFEQILLSYLRQTNFFQTKISKK